MKVKQIKNIVSKKDYVFFDVIYYPHWFSEKTKLRKAFHKKSKYFNGLSYWLDTGELITIKDNITAMLQREDVTLKIYQNEDI